MEPRPQGYPAAITAVGAYAPERVLTNAELQTIVDTTDEWIVTRTGIRERRIAAKGQLTSDMAVLAARKALARRGLDPAEVDLVILATVTPDMPIPASACTVQEKLGARRAWSFDLSGACSGFIYALAVGTQFVATGAHRRVLVIGADTMSTITDYTDRATCVLFGDAAGAVLLEPAPPDSPGILDFVLRADGSGARLLCLPGGGSLHPVSPETLQGRLHYLKQAGRQVFKYAVEEMVNATRELLGRHGLSTNDIALVIPHQANLRILDAFAERMGLPMEKLVVNIDRYGNTTAATIPLAMCEALDQNRLKRGDRVVLASFGAGFTWASALLRWGY